MQLEPVANANDAPHIDAHLQGPQGREDALATRACGCPHDAPCTCGPRLRIFDPMGRLLLSPVYY